MKENLDSTDYFKWNSQFHYTLMILKLSKRERKLNLEFTISWKSSYLEVEVRRGIPVFASMCEGWKNEISAPRRISRQIGTSVSPTFIFRNSCARYPRDTIAVKAISPQVSRLGCIFLPIYSGQPISLPDFTRPFPRTVFTKELVNVSDCIQFTYFPIRRDRRVNPYIDPKFRTNRSLSGKRCFLQFYSLFIYRVSLAKDKKCNISSGLRKNFILKDIDVWIFSSKSIGVSQFSFASLGKVKLFRNVSNRNNPIFFVNCLIMEIWIIIWRRFQWFFNISWASEKSILIGAWLRSES